MTRRGRALQPLQKRMTSLSSLDVWSYLEKHDLTQARFCKWIGVSPRAFQTWAKAEKFPRMLEIIITDELPPRRGGAKSQLGERMAAMSAK